MRAKKTDDNQQEIVTTLRQCGAFVFDLSGVGRGCPDLLVCIHGKIMLMECKSKRGAMTPEQVMFHRDCGYVVTIVRSRLEAIDALNEGIRR